MSDITVDSGVRLPQNHVNAVACLVAAGADVKLGPAEAINPHQSAAAFRKFSRRLVAKLVVDEWKNRELMSLIVWNEKSQKAKGLARSDHAHVVVLYPSQGELTDYPRILQLPKGHGGSHQYVSGWRDLAKGQDLVRQRGVCGTDLHFRSSPVFVASDVSYYFSTEEFIEKFAGHELLQQPAKSGSSNFGITVFVVSRYLPDKPNSLMVERYQAPECSLYVEDDESSDSEDGQPRMVRNDFPSVDAVEAVAEYKEGHIHFHASTQASDSFYRHVVRNDLLTRPRVTVSVDGRMLECQTHVERRAGPYAIVRCLIRCVNPVEVQPDEPMRPWTLPPSFVCYDGRMVVGQSVTLLHCFRTEVEQASSMSAAVSTTLRRALTAVPEGQRKCLDPYTPLLARCAKASVEEALAVSKGASKLTLPYLSGAQSAVDDQVAQRLVDTAHIPSGLANALARMTRKQSYLQFAGELLGALGELAGFVWDLICKWAVSFREFVVPKTSELTPLVADPMSILSASLRLGLAALRKVRGFKSKAEFILGRAGQWSAPAAFLTWAHKHPKTAFVIEELAHVAVCVITAFAEEVLKKTLGFPLTAVFGAVEGIINMARTFISSEEKDRTMAATMAAQLIVHTAGHVLLWLMPLWVSVPLHAVKNFLTERKGRRMMFQAMFDKLAKAQFEFTHLDDFAALEASEPSEDWATKTQSLFVKEPDGTLIPLAEVAPLLNLESKKTAVTRIPRIANPITDLFSKPTNSLITSCMVAVTRLEVRPRFTAAAGFWESTETDFLAMLTDLDDIGFQCMSVEETVSYFESRPWTTAHKRLRIEQYLKAYGGAGRADKSISVKTDEVLMIRDELGDEDHEHVNKSRPLCPVDEVGLLATHWVVPCKKWLSTVRYWSLMEDGDANDVHWKACEGPIGALNFAFAYVLETRADLISEKANYLLRDMGCDIVWLAHGDDMILFWHDPDGQMYAFAFDLKTCDLSSGAKYQTCFGNIVSSVTMGEAAPWLTAWMAAKTGRFKIRTPETELLGIDVVHVKDGVSTITGEMATSLLAVGLQLFPIPRILAEVGANIKSFPEVVRKVLRAGGVDPVFETGEGGALWRDAESLTFLGGAFSIRGEQLSWFSLGVVKQGLLGHSTLPVTSTSMRFDAAVAVSMPDLAATPVGRAIKRLLTRFWSIDEEFRAESVVQWLNDVQHSNRYVAEIGIQYTAPRISRVDYFRVMRKLCAGHGYPDPEPELRSIIHECDADINPGWPWGPPSIQASMMSLYVARFGLPESEKVAIPASPFDAVHESFSMVASIVHLGREIFALLCDSDDMSHKPKNAKPKGKSGKPARWELNLVKVNNQLEQQNQRLRAKMISAGAGSGKRPRKREALGSPTDFPQNNLMASGGRTQAGIQSGIDPGPTINASVSYSVVTLLLQPGLGTLFSWLFTIAQLYDGYEFTALDIIFVPDVSAFAADGSAGRLTLAVDYDVMGTPPISMANAMLTNPNVPAMGSSTVTLRLDPKRLNTAMKYVRAGLVPPGGDAKSYDAGKLYVCTEGFQDANVIGNIFARYKIKFYNPRPTGMNIAPSNNTIAMMSFSGSNVTSGVNAQVVIGAFFIINNIGATISATTANTIALLAGSYLLIGRFFYASSGGSMTSAAAQVSVGTFSGGSSGYNGGAVTSYNMDNIAPSTAGAGQLYGLYSGATFTGTLAVSGQLIIIAV